MLHNLVFSPHGDEVDPGIAHDARHRRRAASMTAEQREEKCRKRREIIGGRSVIQTTRKMIHLWVTSYNARLQSYTARNYICFDLSSDSLLICSAN